MEELGPNRTRAITSIDVKTRFWPIGALLERFVLGPQFHKTVKGAQREFKTYIEGIVEKLPSVELGRPKAVA